MTGSEHKAELAALRLVAAGSSIVDAAAAAGLDASDVASLHRRLVRAASREYHPSRRSDFTPIAAAALAALTAQQLDRPSGEAPPR